MQQSPVLAVSASALVASSDGAQALDKIVAEQRQMLAKNTDGAGFGPQSPRDIDAHVGTNSRVFEAAPDASTMNLCKTHFHENTEHKGGEFPTYAGNGDGHGYGTGFKYNGALADAELAPCGHKVGATDHGDLEPGDTIEVHNDHTTAQIEPGPSLGSCLSEAIAYPQLRVETQVNVLVKDDAALDVGMLTHHDVIGGVHQATNIPSGTGAAVQYAGSTTGPATTRRARRFK